MPSVMLSDLSQMLQLRRDTVRVRQDLATATQELSSGKHADLGNAVSGNYGPLVAIDRQLSALDGFETNAAEATLFADAAQLSLGQVKDMGGDVGRRMMGIKPSDMTTLKEMYATEANEAFASSVAALNNTVAGRAIFAGTATDGRALASADDIMGDLRALVNGETTAEGVVGLVETWFGAGGGFETAGYLGSTKDLTGYEVADGHDVEVAVRADDTAIRDQLKGLALAALLDGSGITDTGELAELANSSASTLLSNESKMVALQAGIGSAQERLENAVVRNASERSSLKMARSEIVEVDPYRVATDLQNLQTQLETIYTITGRLSGLSLTNYLR